MKKLLPLLSVLSLLLFFSCEKENEFGGTVDKEAQEYEFPCQVGNCDVCEDYDFVNPNTGDPLHRTVVEPVIYSEECGCYVSGLVKYDDCGQTIALVWYGDGECDGKGLKTICVNGDCNDPDAKTCEFDLDCEFN